MKRLAFEKSCLAFKVLLPGLFSIVLLIITGEIQNRFSPRQQLESKISHDKSPDENQPIYEALKGLGEIILESYNNYFAFLLMMFLVHVMLHGSDMIKQIPMREKKQVLLSLLKSTIKYSLIFGFYQVFFVSIGLFYATPSLMNTLNEVSGNSFGLQNTFFEETIPSRILEEEQLAAMVDKFDYSRKPSLSIGKVLSQFDMNAVSIKLSKNGRTAFVATNFPSALKVIDISDSEYPIILSSVALSKEFTQLLFKSMIFSPDETKIYISSFEYLEVVDISDFKSPLYLARIEDKSIVKSNYEIRVVEPNLIMSKDAQFLFISGFGLQVFDISKPTAPILINTIPSQLSSGRTIPSSITLSQDGKMLFYTDGSFWIYNVENPRDLKILSSFNTTKTSLISSMVFSKDFKSAFVLGLDSSKESRILIQKLNTEDIYAFKEGQVMQFNISSSSNPVFLNPAPNNLFLPIRFMKTDARTWHNLIIFDTQNQQLVNHEKMFVKGDTLSVLFTEDYKKILVGSEEKLEIVELYLDYPNKNAFTESSNLVQTSDLQMEFAATTFSSSNDESIFYSLSGSVWSRTFGIHRVSADFETFTNISIYETKQQIYEVVISRDNKRAYLVGQKSILIFDISNPENPTLLGQYDEEEEHHSFSGCFVLSGDGKTGFMTSTVLSKSFLRILDFSDPKNPVKKSMIDIGKDDGISKPILSKDERTVFLTSRILSVYNVSDHSSPVFVTNLTFLVQDNYMPGSPQAILSHDGKTLIFKDASSMIQAFVHIIDVTNVSSPQTLSEFKFTASLYSLGYISNSFAISPDSKTLYIHREFRFMVIDISTRSSPRYLGAIKIANPSNDYITNFKLSDDMKKIYLFAKNQKLHIVSLQPKYSTFIKQDTLMLGERYSIGLEVLKMNRKSIDYDRIDVDYRFTKLAFVESRSLQNANFENVVLKPAPSWMSFDLKSQILTVEARRKSDIGVYRVYCAFSTKVQKEDFSTVNETSPENITATLLALGYIDNQLFLTENFEGLEDFILPDNYPDWVRKKIYNILKKYSFTTFNELNVVQSLSMRELGGNKVRISTASLANLKVEINLLKSDEAKFLSRYYGSLLPTITNGKSRLLMEGSLKDINAALQEVVINLGNRSSCDGEIIIDDKLNPIMTESIKNISRLFDHNQPPGLNKNFDLTIQNQVEKEVIWTGQYFQIKLNQKTFFDNYTEVENLNYQLRFVKDNNETTVLPNWLSFHDMTLMGTAPEDIFNRDFDFMLVVKNEFQEFKEPLKIHVKISSNFILKLLVKYSPYILSVVGLFISANKIFNIIFKGSYKHPKDFDVRVGEEITSEVIFPISFIREEIQEAKTIMKYLEKKIGNKDRLLSNFISQGEKNLDRIKIFETIKETLNELSYKEQESLDFYLEGHVARTGLVDQIIINTLTMEMLKSKEERETRTYFEKIKKKWHKFVDWDLENFSFKINDEKFEKVLACDGKETTISTGLLDKSNMHLDLLKGSILAYAFECQNIDILPVSVQFKVKEKIKANFLKRFIKTDLKDCPFSEKGKIGYGIQYEREFNTLCFNGIARPDLQSKTLVFQITDVSQRILREIWIFGKGNRNQSLRSDIEKISYNKNEIEAKGKEYQIL